MAGGGDPIAAYSSTLTGLSQAELDAIPPLFNWLIESGVWSRSLAIFPLLTNNWDSALKNAIVPSVPLTSPILIRNGTGPASELVLGANGITSQGFNPGANPYVPPSKYLWTGVSPRLFPFDSVHITMMFGGPDIALPYTELFAPDAGLTYPQNPRIQMSIKRTNNNFFCNCFTTDPSGTLNSLATVSDFSSNGVFSLNRRSYSDLACYRNGVVMCQVTQTAPEVLPPQNAMIVIPGPRPLQFLLMSKSLTNEQIQGLSNALLTFRAAIGKS